MKRACKKHKMKLRQLREIHHQDVHRNRLTLSERKLLADQTQSIAAFDMAIFSLDRVASPLIIEELAFLLGHQVWITFGPT